MNRFRALVGIAGIAVVVAPAALSLVPAHAAGEVLTVSDAEVDVRGLYSDMNANLVDALGAPIAGAYIEFKELGDNGRIICGGTTDALGNATCKDHVTEPYFLAGVGIWRNDQRITEIAPTFGDVEFEGYVKVGPPAQGLATATFRPVPFFAL